MKFGKQLLLRILPEWEDNYASYKNIKREIKAISDLDEVPEEAIKNLKEFVVSEMKKVDEFSKLTSSQAFETWEELKMESPKKKRKGGKGEEIPEEVIERFSSLFGKLEELKMFVQLNFTAFQRTFKKINKRCGEKCPTLVPELSEILLTFSFCDSSKIDETLVEVCQKLIEILPNNQGGQISKESKLVPPCETVKDLSLPEFPIGFSRVFISLAFDGMSQPIQVPLLVAKGVKAGPVLGITSALHGNELNGIPLIHRLFKKLDVNQLSGTLVAIPVANPPGYLRAQRGYSDGADLNRLFPGKENGTAAQQYCFQLMEKIVKKFEYLIDMHTASVGRVNSLYVRANLQEKETRKMAFLQNPQIIVHNTSPDGSLRGSAMDNKIHAITVEIGDPQRFHSRFVKFALLGVENIMFGLKMIAGVAEQAEIEPTICTKSYWLFSQEGGVLTVIPETNTWVREGDVIARIYSIFGDLIKEYKASEDAIVVGKSVNPMCNSGDRIIHLGVMAGSFPSISNDGHL